MKTIRGLAGRAPGCATWERLSVWLVCCAVFLLPLACLPGLDRPFSVPKTFLLAGLDLAVAAAWLKKTPERRCSPAGEWLALAWVAAVSLSALAGSGLTLEALLLALLPVPMFAGAARGLVPGESLAQALWLGSLCEASIAVLQFCGADPLQWFGWRPMTFASPRMRVYGTMGNPDFVAAWCCATLPFCWHQIARGGGARVLRWAAAGLQIAAILATGSRVFALIVPLQAAMLAPRWKPMKRAWPLALPVAAALLFLAPTRPLKATVEGRLYLARVTASNFEGPLTGHGPGSFEGRFAVWQAAWFDLRRNAEDLRFAGPVDHAHNDYLEILVEYGPAGLAAFLGLAVWVVIRSWRRRAQPVWNAQSAAAIGAASLLAIAMVDFPFHRPAEWALFWLLIGFLSVRDIKAQEDRECRLQPDALRTLES
jgi:hypothetical protein